MNVRAAHAFCAKLPGATLDHKWQFEDSVHPVYSVGGRMFAMFSMKGGKLQDSLMFKADDARFLELTDRDGIVPAPYLARAKWVRMENAKRFGDAELKALLAEAHATIVAKLSKKMQAALLGIDPSSAGAQAKDAAPKRRASRKRAAA